MSEIRIEEARRAYDQEQDAWNRANDAAVNIGNVTLRTAVLINGGAAVAALGFIGSVFNGGHLKPGTSLGTLTSPLEWFAWGVAVATLAMGFGYIVNYANAGLISGRNRTWEHPYIKETATSKVWRGVSTVFTVITLLCGIASICLFVYGMFHIRSVIGTLVVQ
jgi:hypothetical protein